MNTPFRVILVLGFLGATTRADDQGWKPAKGPLATRWAAEVRPDRVHPEYPRPQMVRPDWQNLNGLWEYAIRPRDASQPATFDGSILVPFPIESALSGVMKPVKPDQRLWYRRSFELGARKENQRWLLHFGAVDWDATVFVNGKKLGEHRGGYDPFTFDATDALVPGARQEVVVSVWDPSDTGSQPRGKQVLKPGGIMYTANTGIWQTVWMEPVPKTWIKSLNITPDLDTGEVKISVILDGDPPARAAHVAVLDGDRAIATSDDLASPSVKVPNPRAWSPDSPFLYGLRVWFDGGDEVTSYFGMRKITLAKDDAGVNRLMLNGKPLFQLGPLDQGWWPDGLYTAPTDQALKYDLDVTKALGFNMIRKHVKVEPARWYYWCDKMGILVWQDMPSGDNKDAAAKTQFAQELERMIDALRNHPCIVMWVPFNEGWGQHSTPETVAWIKQHDPTRLVNNASGWTDKGVGDVSDMHNYPGPGMPPTESARAAVLGEFGGLGLPLPGHLWVDNKDNWGYRTFKDQDSLQKSYTELIQRLRGLATMGLTAAVYTQTTDCEVEVNGLMTYDRGVTKLPEQLVAALHRSLYGKLPTLNVVVPTAETSPQLWSYTTQTPAAEWIKPEFEDAGWATGESGFGTKGTPGARPHTEWKTSDIWLRRSFDLNAKSPGSLNLYIHHDEDAEVFLNGTKIAALKGHISSYELVPLGAEAAAALKPGKNVLAVHCHQTGGGQYIDVGLIQFLEPRAANAGPAAGPTEVAP